MAERTAAPHILVVGCAMPPETFIANLLRGWLERGLRVTVAGAVRPGEDWLEQLGFHWLRVPEWEGNPLVRVARLWAAWARAMLASPRDVRRLTAGAAGRMNGGNSLRLWNRLLPFAGRRRDLLYFPWNSAAIEHLPLYELGMPVVVSCRGSQVNVAPHNPGREGLREGLRLTFERSARVHCVSEEIMNEAIQFGLDPNKVKIIRPAVDQEFYTPIGEPPASRPLSIITVGSLVWVKGLEYALMALRQLLDSGVDAVFHIIGDGPERERVLFTIEDLNLEWRVILHGGQTPGQVRDHLRQADVFLLSSLSEGISNAVLEAMSCALPVVTTDCGGMSEAVTDGVEGLVVPVRDPAAMTHALKRLSSDPALRRRMGRAGRARVLREFNLDHQQEQWLALIQEAIHSG